MKIHSSSLNFSAIGSNRYPVNKKTGETNKDSSPSDGQSPAFSPEQIKKVLSEAELANTNNLTVVNAVSDVKSTKALNAYIQELNQPLHDRTAYLISGIDIYA